MLSRDARGSPPGTVMIVLVSCLVLVSVSVIAVVVRNLLDFCIAQL